MIKENPQNTWLSLKVAKVVLSPVSDMLLAGSQDWNPSLYLQGTDWHPKSHGRSWL